MNTILSLLSSDRLREFYAAGHWRDQTLYALVCEQAMVRPAAVALRERQRRLSYGDLIDWVDCFAAELAGRGLIAGQRVAVWMPSRIEAAVVLLACSRNGYVCCPSLHRDHGVAEVVALIERVSARAVIYQLGYGADADRADLAATLARGEDPPIFFGLPGPGPGLSDAGLDVFLGSGDGDKSPLSKLTAAASDPDGIVYLAFTSGTTGEPKGVLHSDNTLLANARAIANDWAFGPSSVIYTMSPLSHNLGLGALVSALIVGAELVIHDLGRGESLYRRLRETTATFLFGVPTHAIDLLSELEELEDPHEPVLPALMGFRISGAAAPPSVVERLIARGIIPQSGYGMTEACSHHYTLPDDPPDRIIGSSGRCSASYEVAIWSSDDRDRRLPPGEVGEIGGRGASLMLGYFDDQAATEAAFNREGWFMTGDLGWVDEGGYIHLVGRAKDIIIRGGRNIFPAKVEALVSRHRAVDKAAAVPVPDERLGEKLCVAVSLRAGSSLSADELLGHLDEAGLSRFDMPEYWLRLERMPLTASGKILKRAISEDISNGRCDPVAIRYDAARHARYGSDAKTNPEVSS